MKHAPPITEAVLRALPAETNVEAITAYEYATYDSERYNPAAGEYLRPKGIIEILCTGSLPLEENEFNQKLSKLLGKEGGSFAHVGTRIIPLGGSSAGNPEAIFTKLLNDGRYVFLEDLGKGAAGRVSRYLDLHTKAKVAAKHILRHYNPQEVQALVDARFKKANATTSSRYVVNILDAIVRTARNRGWPTPRGGHWVSTTVLRLLQNPLYSGFVRFNGKLVAASAEPLIDQVTWNAAQHFRVRPPGRRTPSLILTGRGRVRCGYCESAVNCATSIWYRKDGTKGKTHRYYHCYGRHRGVPCKTLRTVPNWELEGVILGVLGAICEHRNEILDGIQQHLLALQGALPEQRKTLDAQLRSVLAAEDKILKAYEAGAISLEQLKVRNEANRQQTDALQKDIMALDLQIARQGGDFSRARLEQRLDQFRERLQQASFEELRALVDPLVSGILLFNEKAEVTFSFPLDGEVKHVFSLPGKALANDLAPGSVVGRRVLRSKLRGKAPEGLDRMPLGAVLADPRYQVTFARASLS